MAIYYFADNTSSLSHPNAIQGNDAWNGLFPTFQGGSNGPKRTPANFNNNLLQAGDSFLLARGSAWDTSFFMFLETVGSSSLSWDNPIVFDQYDPGTGVTGKPIINCSGSTACILLNGYEGTGDPTEGGFTFRNWHLIGPRETHPEYDSAGIIIGAPLSHILIEDCDIEWFKVGINTRNTSNAHSSYVCIRRNTFQNTGLAGCLGSATHMLMEKNHFTSCGELHALTHAIYYGSGEIENSNHVIRFNTLTDNNIDETGTCVGGNLTVRGKMRYTTIEGNLVENTGAKFNIDAYGISHFPGYSTLEEYHYNTIIRGNKVANFVSPIVFSSAPDIIVENNVIVDTAAVGDAPAFNAIGWPVTSLTSPDVTTDERAIIRNNSIYSKTPRTGSRGIWAAGGTGNSAGDNVTISNNIIRFEDNTPGSIYAFLLSETNTSYSYITNNIYSGGNGWQTGLTSLSSFQTYYDALTGTNCSGNIEDNPDYVQEPTAANGWDLSIQSTSPAIGAADSARATTLSIDGTVRVSPDIGAYEY